MIVPLFMDEVDIFLTTITGGTAVALLVATAARGWLGLIDGNPNPN